MLKNPKPENSSNVMTDAPFFTVLIPTMNRPQLLEAAVETSLRQTFKDFELIVSDNSDDETSITRNQSTVAKYVNDPRVHYIYPPQWMNMPDHWEFASRHASGRYVVILTDRHVMRPTALHFLHTQITYLQEDGKVIAWQAGSTFNRSGIACTHPFTGAIEVLDSKQEIREYARSANWRSGSIFDNRLPRMLNSCYRFDVAHTIREKHGRLFSCRYPPTILAHSCSLPILTDLPISIGRSSWVKVTGGMVDSLVYGNEKYLSSLGEVDFFALTPAPLNTVINSVVRDLLMVRKSSEQGSQMLSWIVLAILCATIENC